MLPNNLPKQMLNIIIPLTSRSIECPETSPSASPLTSDATESSDSIVRDGKDGDQVKRGGAERDGTGPGSTEQDSTERSSAASLASLGPCYVDNVDTDSLARLGFSYVNSDGSETNQQNTKIKQWNCHAVSTYLYSTFISAIPAKFQTKNANQSLRSAAKSTKFTQRTHRIGRT
jgi:hypothetical protein